MTALIRMPRAAWRRQPAGKLEINGQNPLANGLIRAYGISLDGYEAVGKARSATLQSSNVSFTSDGMQFATASYSLVNSIAAGNLSEVSSTHTLSVFSLATPSALTVRSSLWSIGGSVSVGMGYSNPGMVFSYSGTGYTYEAVSGFFVAGLPLRVGFSYDNLMTAGRSSFYKNGSLALRTNPSASGALPASGVFYIGGIGSGSVSTWQGVIALTLVWKGALSESAHAEIAANPYQIFAPRPARLILIPDVAGSAADLAGEAIAQATATGTVATSIPVAAAALAVSTAIGSMILSIPMAGAAQATAIASGAASQQTSLGASASVMVTASGDVRMMLMLEGSAVAAAVAAGDMAATGGLSGLASSTALAAGNITMTFALSGAALAQFAASGNLTATGAGSLTGNAQAQASASGALRVDVALAGSAQAWATLSGDIASIIPVSGVAVSAWSATGNLVATLGVEMSAAALAQASAGGHLTIALPLLGAAFSRAVVCGALGWDGDHWQPSPQRMLIYPVSDRRWTVTAAPRVLTL